MVTKRKTGARKRRLAEVLGAPLHVFNHTTYLIDIVEAILGIILLVLFVYLMLIADTGIKG